MVTSAYFPHSSHGKDASPGPLIDVTNIPTPRKFLDASQYSAAGNSSGKLFFLCATYSLSVLESLGQDLWEPVMCSLGPLQEIDIKPLAGPVVLQMLKKLAANCPAYRFQL